MKALLQSVLIFGLGYVAHQFLPFWAIAVVGVLVGLLLAHKNSLFSFLGGFIGASLLWGGFAWYLDAENLGTLSGKLGELFGASGYLLLLVTGWLGGMMGGFGAMTGTLARKVFFKIEA